MTTAGFINDTLNVLCPHYFVGTFAADLILTKNVIEYLKKRKNWSLITNLSDSNEPGSHFVCIARKKNIILYFDSLGNKAYEPNICKFLSKFKNLKLIYNNIQYQDFNSYFCGLYCIYFVCLCHITNRVQKKLNNKLKSFSTTNLAKNDNIVVNNLISYISVLNKK